MYSKEPELLALAREARWIEWPPANPEVNCKMVLLNNDSKMPKNVRKLPYTRRSDELYAVGFSLKGKYRLLAQSETVEAAARMADVLAVHLDDYRQYGLQDSPEMQDAVLNFPIKYACADTVDVPGLPDWLSRLTALLLDRKFISDSKQDKAVFRSGRPQTAEYFEKLNTKLDFLLQSNTELSRKLDHLLYTSAQPVVTIGIPQTQTATPSEVKATPWC